MKKKTKLGFRDKKGKVMVVTIDIKELYGDQAKLSKKEDYVAEALRKAGLGNDVILTGQGPIWLYLIIAHALHGKVKSLRYTSPVTGEITIFDHNPFD